MVPCVVRQWPKGVETAEEHRRRPIAQLPNWRELAQVLKSMPTDQGDRGIVAASAVLGRGADGRWQGGAQRQGGLAAAMRGSDAP